ncbi:MAG: hypothetical protein ACHQSE_04615 [Gemmatimonadales bacterium]
MTAGDHMAVDARRALLEGLVDYAGLFPPAALGMADAVARYDEYRRSEHRWALGKFVLPVARLDEFTRAARAVAGGVSSWRLALVAGADFGADVRAIALFAGGAVPRAGVGAIEVRAATATQVDAVAVNAALLRSSVADTFDVYVEVPVAGDPAALVAAIASHRLRAKVRTGGVEAGAFPDSPGLARFIVLCTAHRVTFKATAGLHHALRGSYPFTYDPASERGTMFGFLNVFVAALFACDGLDAAGVQALLEERDPSQITFDRAGVTWRGRMVSAEAIRAARAQTATSFGSCSFTEPLADLSTLGLL